MMKAKVVIWIVTAVCILAYAFAYWCEAAYYAGGIGFSEVISLPRLLHSLSQVTIADFVRAEMMSTDLLVPLGALFVAILANRINRPKWRLALSMLTTYNIALVITYGWMGIAILMLMLAGMPGSIDGEYFAENFARLTATGIWSLAVSAITIFGWCSERKQGEHRTSGWSRPEPAAGSGG